MDGRFPAAAGHGCCFSRADDYKKLTYPEYLDVDYVRSPEVWTCHLAHVKQNGFWKMTTLLVFAGSFQKTPYDRPYGRSTGLAGIILGKVESAGSIRCPGGERVS